MQLVTRNMESTNLNRVEGELKSSAGILSSFKQILDKTYDILTNTKEDSFTGLPMWLFEYYSKQDELKESKGMYAPEKYAACVAIRTEFYALLLDNLGMEKARQIFWHEYFNKHFKK